MVCVCVCTCLSGPPPWGECRGEGVLMGLEMGWSLSLVPIFIVIVLHNRWQGYHCNVGKKLLYINELCTNAKFYTDIQMSCY